MSKTEEDDGGKGKRAFHSQTAHTVYKIKTGTDLP